MLDRLADTSASVSTEAKEGNGKAEVLTQRHGFFRQRAADRFRSRHAFRKTNSVINAAAAETSRTGMRSIPNGTRGDVT
jgi:hypothetical protein